MNPKMTLLDCPFCGTDDHETSPWPSGKEWVCNCGNPDCAVEVLAETPEAAVAKWNRRAHITTLAAERSDGDAVGYLSIGEGVGETSDFIVQWSPAFQDLGKGRYPLYLHPPASTPETESKSGGEQAAFEDWLNRVRPSGDCDSVHSQWLDSSNFADFIAEGGEQAGGVVSDGWFNDIISEYRKSMPKSPNSSYTEGYDDAMNDVADRLEAIAPMLRSAPDEQELCALLPGTHYMYPPDGGDVSVIEQLLRMAKDAARYRWLCDEAEWGDEVWRSIDKMTGSDEAIDNAMRSASSGGEVV